MGLSHPYEDGVTKSRNQMATLMNVPAFRQGAVGSEATPAQEFIYHLTSIRKVLNYSTWTHFPSGFPTVRHQDRRVFEYLVDDYTRLRDWLPLGGYARGQLSGFRGFTWWSNLKLLANHIVCGAHVLGLPNTWIPKYALVIRCPASYVRKNNLACVPTTLDGFVSEIFCPADYRSSSRPVCGKTVNLDSPGHLTAGADEFAVKPLDVDEVQFYPVLIDRRARVAHVVRRDARLWQLLEVYYNSL